MADLADIAAFHQKIKPETFWQRFCLVLLCFATMAPAMQLTGFGNVLPNWPLPVWLVISAMVGALVGFTYYPQWRFGVVGIWPGMFAGPCVLLLAYLYTLPREQVFKAEMALVWLVSLTPAAIAYYVMMRLVVLWTSRPSQVGWASGRSAAAMPSDENLNQQSAALYSASPATEVASPQRSIAPVLIGMAIVFGAILLAGTVGAVLLVAGLKAPPRVPVGTVAPTVQPGLPPDGSNDRLSRDEMAELVGDLQSSDRGLQQRAARRLSAVEPVDEVQPAVVAELIEMLSSSEFAVYRPAAQALVQWATPECVPQLVPFLASDDFVLRRHILSALGRVGDPRAAGPIASRLAVGADRASAASALRTMGAAAEGALIAALDQQQDPFVRAEVCRILGTIGTSESVRALESAAQDGNGLVSMAARQAIRSIESRK